MIRRICVIYFTLSLLFDTLATDTQFSDDIAIYTAHVESANALNKAASVIFNLKNVSSQKDIENLSKILINLSLTLAMLNKELAKDNLNITNVQKKTDEVKVLSKLAANVLKVVLNDRNNAEIANDKVLKGLREIFKDVVSQFKQESEEEERHKQIMVSKAQNIALGLREIFKHAANISGDVLAEINEVEFSDVTSLKDIFKSLASQGVTKAKDLLVSSAPNIIDYGLKEIFQIMGDVEESENQAEENN